MEDSLLPIGMNECMVSYACVQVRTHAYVHCPFFADSTTTEPSSSQLVINGVFTCSSVLCVTVWTLCVYLQEW